MRRYVRGRSIAFDGDAPPSEFCLFTRGANPSTKGPAVWDEAAAASVMKFAAERGRVRYMIDLEHRSLDEKARVQTESATNAMAYFNVELRGGDLWAVNVTWTPEGEERLRSKKQVYFSPAYYDDIAMGTGNDGRVLELVNVALTSMPATHDLPSLVAASRNARTTSRGCTPLFLVVAARALALSKKRARLGK